MQELPLSKLKESKDNERNITQKSVNAVKKSIKTYGYNVPIIVTKKHEIIAGHVRYRALKELEEETVTCVVIDETDPVKIAKMRLLDNAISEASSWDNKKLEIELRGIYDLSGLDGWNAFKDMFPDTSELDKMLETSVGLNAKEVTQKSIDKEEEAKGSNYKKEASDKEREVICPECKRKFKARIYEN